MCNNFAVDEALKDKLYKLRTALSLENNVYNELDIYIKASIDEMATYYPETMEELAEIAWMGTKRLEKYGERILEVINEHIRENNLDVSNKKKKLHEVKKEYDKELYEILTRTLLAKSVEEEIANTSLYMIPDLTIMDICRLYPQTEERLLKISGIGVKRYNIFGETILREVQKYVRENEEKVKENLKKYEATTDNYVSILKLESNAIKNQLIMYEVDYPILDGRIKLLINSIYSMHKNYEKPDSVRLIAGGELKTLIRNVIEPLLNYALSGNPSSITVISFIVNRPALRNTLILKYKLMPEELDAINLLYNYANGCDHIFDASNKSEKDRTKSYIRNFEKLNKEEREQIYLNTFKLINKMVRDKNVVSKFELLVSKGI